MRSPRLSNRLGFLILIVVLVGVAGFMWYLPAVKQFYWDLLPSRNGPEPHGSTVFRIVPSVTPYDRWIEEVRGQIPVFEGFVVQDIGTVALRPWRQMGQGVNGLYLRLADYQMTDARILELPPGGKTLPQEHLFETGVYFLDGPGHTLFFKDGQEPLHLDWQAESLVSVPLNVRHQHYNDSDRTVRLLAVTSFPFALNASGSESFVLETRHRFTDRFDGTPDYFRVSDRLNETRTQTNFVPDVRTVDLVEDDHRGPGRMTMAWTMAGNTVIDMHVSQIPPRTHMKAHRHSSDAFILILSGDGYSLTWSGGNIRERTRIDWHKNTLFVPPTYWYHQHFNASSVASRHLAINAPTLVRNLGLRFSDQIEADSPAIQSEWEAETRARERDGL